MALKIQPWTDAVTKQEVLKRFRHASQARKRLEDRWDANEVSVYGFDAVSGSSLLVDTMGNPLSTASGTDPDDSGSRINVSYTFKNLRFIHSQLSANPPAVAMRPTSSDQEDGRKADAADRAVRYAVRKYQMQENTDQLSLGTLVYGTAAMKTVWDSTKGDILDFDEATGEMTLEGDIALSNPHTRNLFLDPDARNQAQLKWVIERVYMDYDEAIARWPKKAELLKNSKVAPDPYTSSTKQREEHYNTVELYEYWETGLPQNAYMGRFCVTIKEGDVIEPCRPSPFRFPKAGSIAKIMGSDLPDEIKQKKIDKLPQMARLPYHIFTDVDVPNAVWGKSALEYAAQLQETLSQIDSAYIDNVRAHGVARLIVDQTAEVSIDMSNSPWDVTKIDTNKPPYFMSVPQLMPEMTASRNNMIQGINDVFGVNDAMMGQQQREQSGASMQYATNQGNMIRRRLFNKYVIVVESIYKAILDLMRKHWTIERMISVLGKEKALESIALKGADIDGGYDVVAEYGVTLSLDPMTRREEILQLQPLFEKAGVPTRTTMKMMKLNELEGMYDALGMAEDRQREYFDEMIATQVLIQPEEMQDHENMIAWAMDYFMSAEFKYLDDTSKSLCREHTKLRLQMAATEKSGGLSAQPQAPGPAPAMGNPGMLPAPAPGVPAAPIASAPQQNPTPITNG